MNPLMFGLDILAISVMVFAIYFPRHRRREMVVAFLAGNVGVLAVASALISSTAGVGLGLGLFGVLSIIRLRSLEIDQGEVAYYFSSLALGVLGGIAVTPLWLAPALMAAILVALFVGDHPWLFGRYRSGVVTLDAAIGDEPTIVARLEAMLGTRVHRITVRRVDYVNDSTTVEVVHEPRPEVVRGGDQAAVPSTFDR